MNLKQDTKTVFVFDRNSKFAKKIEEPKFNINVKDGAKMKTLASLEKDVWTWQMEGILEIHRILTDIFPLGEHLLRFAVADHMGRMLDDEWSEKMLEKQFLLDILDATDGPNIEATEDVSPIGGLTMAIEALALLTVSQTEKNDRILEDIEKLAEAQTEVDRFKNEMLGMELPKLENKGSIVLFTKFTKDQEIEDLEEEVGKLLNSRNEIAEMPSNRTFSPITKLNFFVVNLYADGEECEVTTRPLKMNTKYSKMSTWVISRKATDIIIAIQSLLVAAFDLTSTTVTKIPMKEENRGSANYDVELYHSKDSHLILRKIGVVQPINSNEFAKEGATYMTTKLAWATAPKHQWNMFPCTINAFPCTPVVAFARPSACLTQFVMDGRTVMLDLPKEGVVADFPTNVEKNRLISHVLRSNKGRIFLYAMDFLPKNLQFGHLTTPPIHFNLRKPTEPVNTGHLKRILSQMRFKTVDIDRAGPFIELDKTDEEEITFDKTGFKNARQKLQRITRNVAEYAKDTLIFQPNLEKHFEPMLTIAGKVMITDAELEKCNTQIIKLLQNRMQKVGIVPKAEVEFMKTEFNNDLTDPEEQMRVALVEMARYLANYANFSENHEKLYITFMESLGMDKVLKVEIDDVMPEDLSKTLMEFTSDEKDDESITSSDSENEDKNEEKSQEEEKEETIVNRKRKRFAVSEKTKMEKNVKEAKYIDINLFDILCEAAETHVAKTRREFVGREAAGDNKAELYPQLAAAAAAAATAAATTAESTDEKATAPFEERLKNEQRAGSGTPPPRQQISRY